LEKEDEGDGTAWITAGFSHFTKLPSNILFYRAIAINGFYSPGVRLRFETLPHPPLA